MLSELKPLHPDTHTSLRLHNRRQSHNTELSLVKLQTHIYANCHIRPQQTLLFDIKTNQSRSRYTTTCKCGTSGVKNSLKHPVQPNNNFIPPVFMPVYFATLSDNLTHHSDISQIGSYFGDTVTMMTTAISAHLLREVQSDQLFINSPMFHLSVHLRQSCGS